MESPMGHSGIMLNQIIEYAEMATKRISWRIHSLLSIVKNLFPIIGFYYYLTTIIRIGPSEYSTSSTSRPGPPL